MNNNNNVNANNNTNNNNNKNDLQIIWIDYSINNNENKEYQKKLKVLLPFKGFNSIEDGLKEILNIKFKRVILILSKRMFNDFILLFNQEKNKIFCCLNILVFTVASKKYLVEEICDNNKDISSGYIFEKTNIFENINQIIDFIKKEKEGKINNFEHFEMIENNNEMLYDEDSGNFEKIEYLEELILPIYFHKIIEPITLEEIHNFNYYLLNSFGRDGSQIKKIISQFENIAEMPIEIICKYWMRAYTIEKGKFYAILNNGLKAKKFKLFLPYIKMMYEGIKRKVFNSSINEKLYSGGYIYDTELEKLKNNLNNNIKVIYYFKSFKSFSKNLNKAKNFIKPGRNGSTSLLFTLENHNNNIDGVSNADIKEFSYFPNEEEVLFFPFSSFEVEKIENVDEGERKYVNIILKYLGKNIPNIKHNIFKDLPKTEFGKDITEMGLIKYKFNKFYEVEKELSVGGTTNCLLIFEKKKVLFSMGKILRLDDINENKKILEINIHQKEITDLFKINNDTFISSSKDAKINITKLINNFASFNLIITIKFHSDEVNQTIKLQRENMYASCSNDKKINIWNYELEKEISPRIKNILMNSTEVLSIFELQNYNIISIDKKGYLKFWEFKDNNYNVVKTLRGFKNILHNCMQSLNEEIISVATKKVIFLIDINTKIKIKRFLLDYNSYSIGYLNDSIFLGLKHNINSCLLFEYNIEKKYEEFNFDCIGKGRDLCSEISFICPIDEKTIVTINKLNKIKVWKLIDKKPKLLLIEKNSNYNFEEGYDSSEEILTPGNDDNDKVNAYSINNNGFNLINNEEPKKKESNNLINSSDYKQDEHSPSNSKLNIIFNNNGVKTTIICDKFMTVEQLIKIYNEKCNNNINSKNIFFFNGKKLDIKSRKKVKDLFFAENSIILVLNK